MRQQNKELTPWQIYKQRLGDSRPWHAVQKDHRVDTELSLKRYSVCEGCPSLIKVTKQCKECGCFMKIKTKIDNATCPLGKW
jgi:hypothetical protein